jgi:hypothetical protein
MAENNYEKESNEGYESGSKGESSDTDPYKNDSVSGRMASIVGDVLTGNVANHTQEQDNKSEAWQGGHNAASEEKNK